jgi:hypothetical protein
MLFSVTRTIFPLFLYTIQNSPFLTLLRP